jgi:hypothetical protein
MLRSAIDFIVPNARVSNVLTCGQQSVVDWAVGQQKSGVLASKLSNLVVMGCSAGSIGTQIWANQIMRSLSWKQAAVVPDSYAGVFPAGTQGPLIYSYGACSTEVYGWMSAANQAKCKAQTLTLQDLNSASFSEFPQVPYSFLQSKTDIVQQSFYVAVGASMNASAVITPTEFYNDVNEIFGTYNKNHPNFLTYLVDGDQHCFTCLKLYYSADPKSSTDNGASTTSPMMYSWTNEFPLSNGEEADTICDR